MSGLHEAFAEIVADVPVYGDLERAIEQAESERRRRYGVVAGLAAAAAVVAVIVGVLTVNGDTRSHQPIAPPTPTSTNTEVRPGTLVNGRIQSLEDYLAWVGPGCESCDVYSGALEQDTATLLVTWGSTETDDLGLSVFGPEGQLADISLVGPNELLLGNGTCNDDRPCGSGLAALGPGADEVSVQKLAYGAEVLVLGFDGTLRRTIDLSAAVDEEQVRGLAWSPDGSRLAVVTRKFSKTPFGTGVVSHIWLVDRDGGEPQLVHTASQADSAPEGTAPAAFIMGPQWSPDASRLGFIEQHGHINPSSGEGDMSSQAVSLRLPAPGQDETGNATTLYEYAEPLQDTILWSPDGTRVAIKDDGRVLELSAEDGTVLDRYSLTERLLIWPARQP